MIPVSNTPPRLPRQVRGSVCPGPASRSPFIQSESGPQVPGGFGSVFTPLSESETKGGGGARQLGLRDSPFILNSQRQRPLDRWMAPRGAGRADHRARGRGSGGAGRELGGPGRVGGGMEGAEGRGAGVRVCASERGGRPRV